MWGSKAMGRMFPLPVPGVWPGKEHKRKMPSWASSASDHAGSADEKAWGSWLLSSAGEADAGWAHQEARQADENWWMKPDFTWPHGEVQ